MINDKRSRTHFSNITRRHIHQQRVAFSNYARNYNLNYMHMTRSLSLVNVEPFLYILYTVIYTIIIQTSRAPKSCEKHGNPIYNVYEGTTARERMYVYIYIEERQRINYHARTGGRPDRARGWCGRDSDECPALYVLRSHGYKASERDENWVVKCDGTVPFCSAVKLGIMSFFLCQRRCFCVCVWVCW